MPVESRRRESTKAHHKPSQQHSLTTLKRAVRELGARTLDRRTKVGRALGTCPTETGTTRRKRNSIAIRQRSKTAR